MKKEVASMSELGQERRADLAAGRLVVFVTGGCSLIRDASAKQFLSLLVTNIDQ